WQITPGPLQSEGGLPSYLFGTIHSEDPRVAQLPSTVQRAFDDSTGLCTEMALDPSTLTQLAQSMVYMDGQDLRSVIGTDLFRRIAPLMAKYGVPQPALPH